MLLKFCTWDDIVCATYQPTVVCVVDQLVPTNTHFSPSATGSLIHLAFISCQSSLCGCSTIPPLGNSDHYEFELSLKWKLPNLSQTQLRKNYLEKWPCGLRNCEWTIKTVDWESLIANDIDVAWQNLEIEFMSIMDQCVPKATIPFKRNLPWLPKELTKSICGRNLVYKNCCLIAFPFV